MRPIDKLSTEEVVEIMMEKNDHAMNWPVALV